MLNMYFEDIGEMERIETIADDSDKPDHLQLVAIVFAAGFFLGYFAAELARIF